MGHKVNPTGIRLGIIKDWTSRWFAEGRQYADNLNTDLKVRTFLKKRLANASVSRGLNSTDRAQPSPAPRVSP